MRPLYHKFGITNINVYDIISIWTGKRFFMIFDRDYKYTLSILYKNEQTILIPMWNGSYQTMIPSKTYTQTSTLRYKHKDDVMNEYNIILAKCRHVGNNIKHHH